MKHASKINNRMVMGLLFIVGLVLLVPLVAMGQVSSLDDVNQVLNQNDAAFQGIAETVAKWVFIAGGIAVIMIAIFKQEWARPAIITYVSLLIFWFIVQALWF